jgi:hypothetical protein
MSDAPNNITPHSQIPQITALSIAFPLNFESTSPDSPKRPTNPNATPAQPARPPRRHDAGE